MSQVKLESNKREKSGKGVARKLRAQGRIPGVLYGRGSEPISLDLDEKALATMMKEQGLNPIIELSIGNGGKAETHTCMIADFQKDVFQRFLLHVDFKLVDLKEKVDAAVRISVEGEEEIRSRAGIVQMYLDSLSVRCLPLAIPKSVDVNISKLKPGDQLTVADLQVPDGVEVLDEQDTVVLSVTTPRASTSMVAGEGEEFAPEGEAPAEGEAEGEGAATETPAEES